MAHDHHASTAPPRLDDDANPASSALMDDSVFAFPNTLNAADIMHRSSVSYLIFKSSQ